ncbi:hypothetical protein Fmac_023996 [Flemingia macrophylla]|uniref:F-box protein n=1 Tax=Flemingia macrophylla TaxID=520843 RepID=A0ABD1LN89_9FABA
MFISMNHLRSVKDVSLGWIGVNTSTLKTLLSICRNLESLSLKKCWNLDHFDFGGRELGLRRLVIDNCDFVNVDYVGFSAPNLKFFKYIFWDIGGFSNRLVYMFSQYAVFYFRTLKVVELKGFRGTTNEVWACIYLIQAGCVLEQIIVDVVKKEADAYSVQRYANERLLLKVPKASKNLQISIV